jgi:ABC-type glycerol-3-phosphate transport system permease component
MADSEPKVVFLAGRGQLHGGMAQLNFPRLLFNTAAVAVLSTIAAVVSACLVAYGFARFHFPGKNIMFIILLATIILPFQVTLIPTYIIFTRLGWNGTWLPLISAASVRQRIQRLPVAPVLHVHPARP